MPRSSFVHILLLSPLLSAQSLQVDAVRHDFGKIPNTVKATHAFKLTNAGDKDLVIANVRPSCGCTSTVTGKSTLAPGESTTIEATFTPGGAGGQVEKTIQVSSNDSKNPTTTLTLAAEVLREIFTEPPGATFFELPRKGTRELTLRLKSDAGEVKVEGVDTGSTPYLAVTSRNLGGETFLDLRFDAVKLQKGPPQGNGAFQVKTARGSLQVPVMWSLVRIFAVTPERIGMQLEAGKEAQASIRISRMDGKPFKLLGIEDPKASPLGLVLPEKDQGTSLEATVRIPADLPPGNRAETLRIRTDDPDEPVIVVPVSLMVTTPKPADPKPAENPKPPKSGS